MAQFQRLQANWPDYIQTYHVRIDPMIELIVAGTYDTIRVFPDEASLCTLLENSEYIRLKQPIVTILQYNCVNLEGKERGLKDECQAESKSK